MARELVLFAFEKVNGDGSGVVGIEELLAFGGQVNALPFEARAFGGGCGLQGVEVFEDEGFDGVAQGL